MGAICSGSKKEEWDNSGLFSSTKEWKNETKLTFDKQLPTWLKGCLYRNGPGQFEINNDPKTSVHHAFDGFAYIQKYQIDGELNTIHFRTSFIKSRTYEESLKHGHLVARQFGTDPCKSIFGRFQLLFSPLDPKFVTDDAGVTIQRVNNELLALTETVVGYVIDEKTLETVAPLTTLPYTEPLQTEILTLSTAHTMYNSKRKMTVGYAIRMTRSHGHWLDVVFVFDDDQNQQCSITDKQNDSLPTTDCDDKDRNEDDAIDGGGRFIFITNNVNERGKKYNKLIKSKTKSYRYGYDQGASYMHSASITEDYLILSEIPLQFSLTKSMMAVLSDGLLTDMFKWNDALPTYFRIISLDNGEEVARIPGPAFFTFHHINAYQAKENDEDHIIIDICAYDDHRLVKELYLNKLRQNMFPSGLGYVRRFDLNLKTQQCTEPYENHQKLSDNQQQSYPNSFRNSLVPVQFDLPRINSNFIGKLYRYIYAVRGPPDYKFDALIKIDLQTQTIAGLWKEPRTSPSEPVFVQNPDSIEEDNGIILTVVFEQETNKSFILILDAGTFEEVARAYLPIHIPFSLHGNFYATASGNA
ncbi:unnamed protein product [Adineta steineri]|uniref:Uncharacterized protein n=1 Tax=Adineta steineri TaxID=433720 RepID=A0A819JPR4_9BILA|nr:unnamed protein product [Adineta steineri]CAF1238858.1 unnamed protein product [Adineta steineri]CAF3533653.1 unnamed protein product [Adineta steineri]CAF3936622.1 unnamed protein product [Adineta steineri]